MQTSKIRLLLLTGTYAVGGKERQITELIANLPAEEYEIHLFVKKKEAYYFDRIEHKLTSFYSLEKNKFSMFDLFKIAKYIYRIKPDVIHSWATLTSHFVALSKLLVKCHFKIINGAIRDAPIDLPLAFKIEAIAYSFYHVVVSNSKAGLKAYSQIDKMNRYVIPNGIDLTRIPNKTPQECRSNLQWPHDCFIVTMVACMAKRKDFDTLIRAASHCLKQGENIIFMLVGDGEDKDRLIEAVFSLGIGKLSKHIVFLGERSDVEEIFIASDLSILLSAKWHGEGLPNVVMESMACGTPVIASNNGGTCEIVENGVNGYLVPCGDDHELAKNILFLRDNPAKVKELGNNAKDTVHKKYSVSSMVNSYANLYKTVLNL